MDQSGRYIIKWSRELCDSYISFIISETVKSILRILGRRNLNYQHRSYFITEINSRYLFRIRIVARAVPTSWKFQHNLKSCTNVLLHKYYFILQTNMTIAAPYLYNILPKNRIRLLETLSRIIFTECLNHSMVHPAWEIMSCYSH